MEHHLLADKVEKLEKELSITDQLLVEQHRVMDIIPECPVHGNRCIPHAMDWIKRQLEPVVPDFQCVSEEDTSVSMFERTVTTIKQLKKCVHATCEMLFKHDSVDCVYRGKIGELTMCTYPENTNSVIKNNDPCVYEECPIIK